MRRRFHQVDVFTAMPLKGNPLAVVHAAVGLSDATMAAFARWTNLSETTFLLPPVHAEADYRVRIFTPAGELPFAGHPTLGSCWAWPRHRCAAPGPSKPNSCSASPPALAWRWRTCCITNGWTTARAGVR